MLLLMPIYTTYMTTSELGMAELVFNSMNLIYPLATYNILSAMLRYGMDSKYDHQQVLCCSTLTIIAGMVCSGCIIYIWGNLLGPVALWKRYLFLLLVSYASEQTVAVFAKALGRNVDFAAGNIIYTFTLFIISIVLIQRLSRGTSGYLESIILANVITFLYFCIRLKIYRYAKVKSIDLKLLREMIFFSVPLIFNSMSWWLYSFSDRFILEYFSGTDAVGIYSAAAKIPAIVTAVSSVFMQAWVISAIKEYNSDTKELFFSVVFEKYSAVIIVFTSGLICACHIIVPMLNRGDFGKSLDFVPFMLLGAVIGGFANFFAAFYTSAKKNLSVLATTILGAFVNIIANIILIPKCGIYGAVFSAIIAQLLMMLYRMLDTQRFIGFHIKINRLISVIILLMLESYVAVCCDLPILPLLVFLIIAALYKRELIFDLTYRNIWRR